jgi:hypothetical protein
VAKGVKQKLNYSKKHWPAALEKYEQQEKIIGEQRSNYCKTNTDATFMRMKEDHMKSKLNQPTMYRSVPITNTSHLTVSIKTQ